MAFRAAKKRLTRAWRRNSVKAGTALIILLTLLSAFGAVLGRIDMGVEAKPSAEFVGSWGGQEFYKKDEKHYFTVIEGEKWNFRGDPMEARNVSVTPSEESVLRALKGVEEVVLLIDPKADERVLVASTDIARLMGVLQLPTRYAFTERSEGHPEVPEMSAWDSSERRAVFVFESPSNETRVSSQYPIRPHTIYVQGEDFDQLDAAAAKVSLITFGVTE